VRIPGGMCEFEWDARGQKSVRRAVSAGKSALSFAKFFRLYMRRQSFSLCMQFGFSVMVTVIVINIILYVRSGAKFHAGPTMILLYIASVVERSKRAHINVH
jgi:hypothetical protein